MMFETVWNFDFNSGGWNSVEHELSVLINLNLKKNTSMQVQTKSVFTFYCSA